VGEIFRSCCSIARLVAAMYQGDEFVDCWRRLLEVEVIFKKRFFHDFKKVNTVVSGQIDADWDFL
jgi:hypothetical protein